MKLVNPQNCPVCGMSLVRVVNVTIAGRKIIETDLGKVEAKAFYILDNNGEMTSARLRWTCRTCGALWGHKEA